MRLVIKQSQASKSGDNAAPAAPKQDATALLEKILAIQELQKKSYRKGSTILPYYNERQAKDVRTIISEVLKGKIVSYSARELKVGTVYNKFQQGKQYLLEHMDPTGEWAQRVERICLERKEHGILVKLKICPDIDIQVYDDSWKKDLEAFLDGRDMNSTFERTGLTFPLEDLRWAEGLLKPREAEFVWNLAANEVFVARIESFVAIPKLTTDKPDLV